MRKFQSNRANIESFIFIHIIRKVASPHVQVALQPHESRKLNLVVPEKSSDFSYTIRKVTSSHMQVALQLHESKKLNLVAPEKSDDFSYAIKKKLELY